MNTSQQTLEQGQISALVKLSKAIAKIRERVHDRSSSREQGLASFDFVFENVLGILGRRGAGKSTVLMEQYQRMMKHPGEALGRRVPLILSPLDCTSLPADLVPGAAVLIHLHEALKNLPIEEERRAAKDSLINELNSLIGIYSRTTKAFLELCLDISTTPRDFGVYFADGLRDRMRLRANIAALLVRVGDLFKFDLVVVLLDDFDLVPAEAVRRWLAAFLDDLHQQQLLFILTADFHRLEYLSWSAEDRVDDKTGRALLQKIIPPESRIELPAWPLADRMRYRPQPTDPTLADLFEKLQFGLAGTLRERPWSQFWRQLETLVPELPRGVSSLYAGLEQILDPQAKENLHYQGFLSLLASARLEPLLARRLSEIAADSWPANLGMTTADVNEIEWGSLVRNSSMRFKNGVNFQLVPLLSLLPSPLAPELSPDRRREDGLGLHSQLDRDPQWQDPLRHDHLRLLPLRDVATKDLPLFTELLLDLGFVQNVSQRLSFIFGWQVLSARLEQCCIRLNSSSISVESFFRDNYGLIHREAFSWMTIEEQSSRASIPDGEGAGLVIAIGIGPLLDAFRSGREVVPWSLLDDLRIGRGWQANPSPVAGYETEFRGKFVPGSVSAMILLVEGLKRCPWSALAGRSTQPLVVYIGVACAFVKEAFWWALCNSTQEAEMPEESNLISYRVSRSQYEHSWDDGTSLDLVTQCWQFLQFKIEFDERSPAGESFAYFLNSPYYTSVVDLLDQQPEVQWFKAREAELTAEAATTQSDEDP